MSRAKGSLLRIGVIGGGPSGCLFALYALEHARLADKDVAITIYEPRDVRRTTQAGCQTGLAPASVIARLKELSIEISQELNRIDAYSLHTSAGTLETTATGPDSEQIGIYRGGREESGLALAGFDDLLMEEAISRGAVLKNAFVKVVRRARGIELFTADEVEAYDLVVLATGVNARSLWLRGFDYRPPPTMTICQMELYHGLDEVSSRLGSRLHIFLPPDDIATYGIVAPQGPFVRVVLLNPRKQDESLLQFLALQSVAALLGPLTGEMHCRHPRVSVGIARNFVADNFVAIGDAAVSRMYRNSLGSAIATAEWAAYTAIYHGCSKADFESAYLPLCESIHSESRTGADLFVELPILKRFQVMSTAHHRLAAAVAWAMGGEPRHPLPTSRPLSPAKVLLPL